MALKRRQILRSLGLTTAAAITREIYAARHLTADTRSFLRLSADIVLYRALKLGDFGIRNRERTIRFRNGAIVTYRLNRGDIQGIREVWFDEVYRLPFESRIDQIVDLGANIGLTSLYFAKVYGASTIIAIEPNPENATLAARNLHQNGIAVRVIEAAIGPMDGTACFSDTRDSNLGRLSEHGRKVRVISIPTLCLEQNINSIDLLKMDIEGGEQALLSGPIEWLDDVGAVIAEFHPMLADYPALVDRIVSKGFRWIRPNSVDAHPADAFIRSPALSETENVYCR